MSEGLSDVEFDAIITSRDAPEEYRPDYSKLAPLSEQQQRMGEYLRSGIGTLPFEGDPIAQAGWDVGAINTVDVKGAGPMEAGVALKYSLDDPELTDYPQMAPFVDAVEQGYGGDQKDLRRRKALAYPIVIDGTAMAELEDGMTTMLAAHESRHRAFNLMQDVSPEFMKYVQDYAITEEFINGLLDYRAMEGGAHRELALKWLNKRLGGDYSHEEAQALLEEEAPFLMVVEQAAEDLLTYRYGDRRRPSVPSTQTESNE